jgi:hypothetical protein
MRSHCLAPVIGRCGDLARIVTVAACPCAIPAPPEAPSAHGRQYAASTFSPSASPSLTAIAARRAFTRPSKIHSPALSGPPPV